MALTHDLGNSSNILSRIINTTHVLGLKLEVPNKWFEQPNLMMPLSVKRCAMTPLFFVLRSLEINETNTPQIKSTI